MKKWAICCGALFFAALTVTACGKKLPDESALREAVEESGEREENGNKEEAGGVVHGDADAPSGREDAEIAADGIEPDTGAGGGKTETPDTGAGGGKTETSETGEQPLPALAVQGTGLADSSGNAVQLRGISTHGLAWYPEYVNQECIRQLRDWGANVLRLAMYTGESGGYCSDGDQEALKKLIRDGVEYATDCGMYVIIDWHILSDGNPNTHLEEAKAFFDEMSELYSGYTNILYEICNEPNGGTSWSDVKDYAEQVIPVIRKNDQDGIILVGTPNWCQYVEQAAADPITGYENVMYTLHFYAATHMDSLREALVRAMEAGLPVFVSEFGICDASGSGAIDEYQADKWVELLDTQGISYVAWNLSNKSETSAILKSSCEKLSGFSEEDLSDSGRWLYKMLEAHGSGGGKEEGNKDKGNENDGIVKNEDADAESGETESGGADAESGEAGPGGADAESGKAESGGADAESGEAGSGGADAESGEAESGGVAAEGGEEIDSLDVEAMVIHSWEQDGETCFQYEVTVSNSSEAEQIGWTIRLNFNCDIILQDSWNGVFETDGKILTISSMDYNSNIAPGGSVGNVGFIIKSDHSCRLED